MQIIPRQGRSKGPCDVFDPWVRCERGQVGICPAAASENLEIWESWNLEIWGPENPEIWRSGDLGIQQLYGPTNKKIEIIKI